MPARFASAAVVTGSSGGIGRAVAQALAARGVRLCLSGRSLGKLRKVAREIESRAAQVFVHCADVSSDEGIRGLVERAGTDLGRVDLLVHAAGALRLGNIEAADWDDFDEQYRVNLRGPFLLTKAFLPLLKESNGQVVFVNSTSGLTAGVDNGLYAATKHGLRSLAASIREHVNQYGVRVLSVFPGRTASAMQEVVHEFEGRRYQPADLLQPNDVADLIVAALALPQTAEVTDIAIRPMRKPTGGGRRR